jgi:hypothetical protein
LYRGEWDAQDGHWRQSKRLKYSLGSSDSKRFNSP